MNQPTPAIVTQDAVRRLPRLALLLFCLAYVIPGFIGREPWKNADIAAFGHMYELALGNASNNAGQGEQSPFRYSNDHVCDLQVSNGRTLPARRADCFGVRRKGQL